MAWRKARPIATRHAANLHTVFTNYYLSVPKVIDQWLACPPRLTDTVEVPGGLLCGSYACSAPVVEHASSRSMVPARRAFWITVSVANLMHEPRRFGSIVGMKSGFAL